jgi:hypothetical protein
MTFSAVLADLVAEGSDSAGFVAAAVEELKRAAAGRKADDKRRSNMMVGNDWGGKVGRCEEMMWDEDDAVALLKIAGKVEEQQQHIAAEAVRGQPPPTSLFSPPLPPSKYVTGTSFTNVIQSASEHPPHKTIEKV